MPYNIGDILTEGEVASFLKCSPKTLQKNRQQKKGIQFFKVGSLVRYKYADVLQYIQEQSVPVINLETLH